MNLVTVEDWGEEIFAKGVGMQWKKWGGGGKGKCSTLTLPLHQASTVQTSNYNPKWRHQKPGLSSTLLQSIVCTAVFTVGSNLNK